jgi:hypothetical protein
MGTALIVGAITAGLLAMIFAVREVPDVAMRLVGGPTGIARHGGVRVRIRTPRDGASVIVEVPGVREADARPAAEALVQGARFFDVKEDLSLLDAPTTPDVVHDEVREVSGALRPESRLAVIAVEHWRDDGTATDHRSAYLYAATRDALVHGFERLAAAGWHPPPETRVVFESVAMGEHTLWRSYVVAGTAAMDSSAVSHAERGIDPRMHRTVVFIDFTSEGRATFADWTGRIVGHKLATVLGDQVVSAPVVNAKIAGGRMVVTLGNDDGDPTAAALIAALTTPPMPPGCRIEDVQWQPPGNSDVLTALARIAIGLVGGASVALLVGLAIRVARPTWQPRPPRATGKLPLARIAMTLLAPISLYVLRAIPLATVRGVPFSRAVEPGTYSLAGIGFRDALTAFVIVELAIACWPSWRARRDQPGFRRAAHAAVAPVALALALAHAYTVVRMMITLDQLPSSDALVDASGLGQLIATLSLAGATMWLVWIAGVITRRGIGNGYVALLVADWLLRGAAAGAPPQALQVELAVLAALAVVTVAMLRMRVARDGELGLRVPTSGTLALGVVFSLPLGLSQLILVLAPSASVPGWIQVWNRFSLDGWPIALVSIACIGWSYVLARPSRLAPYAARGGLAAPSPASWRRATLLSVVGIAWVAAVGQRDAAMVMIATAAVLDWLDELRIRRGDFVAVWALHQPQVAEGVRRALADAGIACELAGSHVRSLLYVFGPYAPIEVYVPPAAVDDARAILARIVTPDAAAAAA